VNLPEHSDRIPATAHLPSAAGAYEGSRFLVEAEPEAVSDARHRITSVVRSWDVPLLEAAYDDLALVAGEVITNAVRYSGAPCGVAVWWTGVRVRVEVTDCDPVRPSPRESAPDAEGGRGLVLVEAVAAAWGSRADPAGKVVWFEVGPRDAPGPAPGAAPARVRRTVHQVRVALPFALPAGRRSINSQEGRLT
jgi:anti-sigma regulatory factor (Ser/Thr protein kinase)